MLKLDLKHINIPSKVAWGSEVRLGNFQWER